MSIRHITTTSTPLKIVLLSYLYATTCSKSRSHLLRSSTNRHNHTACNGGCNAGTNTSKRFTTVCRHGHGWGICNHSATERQCCCCGVGQTTNRDRLQSSNAVPALLILLQYSSPETSPWLQCYNVTIVTRHHIGYNHPRTHPSGGEQQFDTYRVPDFLLGKGYVYTSLSFGMLLT